MRGSVFVHIEFAIDAIHAPGVEKDQRDEDVDRALLRKPEPQLKTANADLVHLFNEQDTEAIRADKPDDEANRDEAQVGTPVSHAEFRMHIAPKSRSSPQRAI